MKNKTIGIMTTRKTKIDFLLPFLISLAIMIAYEIIKNLAELPPLFSGADTLYDIILSVFSIASQLSVSFAAAIVFYYLAEFLNKRKALDKYIDCRRVIRTALIVMLDDLTRVDIFSSMRLSVLNKRMYDGDDIQAFNHILRENDISSLTPKFEMLFIDNDELVLGLSRMLTSLSSSLGKNSYEYFKNSSEMIDGISNSITDFEMYSNCWIESMGENKMQYDSKTAMDEMTKSFLYAIYDIFEYEERISLFMDSINQKKIITFMKLLD